MASRHRRRVCPGQGVSFFATDEVVNEHNFARVAALTAFARERGHAINELAISWLAAQDGVMSAIAGVTTPEQVRVNVAAADWALTAADLADLP